MNFIPTELVPERRGRGKTEIIVMLERYVSANIDAAEVKDWQNAYKNIDGLYCALRGVVKELYPEMIKVMRVGDHVYMKRIDEVVTSGR